MDPIEIVFLVAAGFVAGAINGVVGGGTLVSFPALLAVGLPAKVANVTNAVAIWPGYVSAAAGYRRELRGQRRRAVTLAIPSTIGAIAGAVILLATSEDTFEEIVPFLVLIAVALMAFQGPIRDFAEQHQVSSRGGDHIPPALHVNMLLTGVYGAYFGAGLGVMNLAILTILLPDELHHSNALRAVLSLLVNGIAAVSFALFGPVDWPAALAMAGGSLAGGYLGVGVARRLGPVWLRWAVIALGLVSAAVLFVQ